MPNKLLCALAALPLTGLPQLAAAMTCLGKYDTVPWPSPTNPTISHNVETYGAELYLYNAWAATCSLSYINLPSYTHVPAIGPSWGMYFVQTPVTRLGCYLHTPYGPYFHEWNTGSHPTTGVCYWGFDLGSFESPYFFNPEWDLSLTQEGSYVGKFFGP